MSILNNARPVPSQRRLRDSGHLLLAILLMMALMVIAATYEAPRLVQQLKRDREEEMIHRGTEYARAIKKYYKKMGAYPSTIEQLESTNNIRFLRKRYKDPLSKDGKWTLLHYSDVATTLGNAGGGPGIPAAGLASQGLQGLGNPAGQQGSSPFGSSFGSSGPTSSGGFGTSNFGSANTQPVNQNGLFSQQPQQQATSGYGQQQGTGGSTFGSSNSQATGDASSSGTGSSPFGSNSPTGAGPGGPNSPSTTLGSQQGLGGQAFGAGAIMGVASKSKDPTIRIYNKKKAYDEWQFIYNPAIDQANVLLKGPYSPSAFVGASNIGTPAGQQPPQNGPFGPQNSPFGSQQPGGTNNPGGTLTPGGQQFPPDQNH